MKKIKGKTSMRNIAMGVEIECVFNSKIHDTIDVGDYHDGNEFYMASEDRVSDYWEVQNDSSIHREEKFPMETCAEFVSNIFRTKEKLFEGLNDFYEEFSRDGKYELNKVLYFNNSVGCHIHFSIRKFNFGKKVVIEVFKDMKKKFLEELDKSGIKKSVREQIKSQYNRDFAKPVSSITCDDRDCEFNFESEMDGRGLEWRSFNLRGITKWDEFFKLFEIAWKCLNWLYKNSQKYEIINNMRINTDLIKKDIEDNTQPKVIVVPKVAKNGYRKFEIKEINKAQRRTIKLTSENKEHKEKLKNGEDINIKLTKELSLSDMDRLRRGILRDRDRNEVATDDTPSYPSFENEIRLENREML